MTAEAPPPRNAGVSILELALKVRDGILSPEAAAEIVRKSKDGEGSHVR